MRINENTCLIGQKVILVPYRREHVPLYHDWMGDEWIREMTASERLSLEQEYINQQSWHLDSKKLTFIILDKSMSDTEGTGIHGGSMAGDCNLFFHDEENPNCAEIEIMIAESKKSWEGFSERKFNAFNELRYSKVKLQYICGKNFRNK